MLDFNSAPEPETTFPQANGAEDMPTNPSHPTDEDKEYQQAVENWENEGGAILHKSA